MKTFTAKYDIGEEVYFVRIGGISSFYGVEKGKISRISFGGKAFEKYEINSMWHFKDSDIYKDAEEARKNAEKKAKAHCERNIETLKEEKIPDLNT